MLKITLKSARVNAGLTQKEAAKKLGISNKTLCSWENGISSPTAKKTALLCSIYGIEYDNLNFFEQ